MFSIPLMKQELKENIRLWLIVTGVMVLYMMFVIVSYVPGENAGILALAETLPAGFRTALGVKQYDPSFAGVLGVHLYGTAFMIIPLFFGITASCRLTAAKVERGTMAWLLSAPVSRGKIVFTQVYYLIFSLLLMFLVTCVSGIMCALWRQPEAFEMGSFILMNLGAFCMHFCLSAMAFAASCACNEKSTALMIGMGIPVLFYLIRMLSNMGGLFDYLKYVTVFTLCSTEDVLDGSIMFAWKYPVLILVGVFLYWLGMRIFERRDLPL